MYVFPTRRTLVVHVYSPQLANQEEARIFKGLKGYRGFGLPFAQLPRKGRCQKPVCWRPTAQTVELLLLYRLLSQALEEK